MRDYNTTHRHDLIQRLNKKSAPKKPDYTGYLALMVIGFTAIALYSIDHYFKDPKVINQASCINTKCHFRENPIIGNGQQYKRIVQHKTILSDRETLHKLRDYNLLAELLTAK